MNRASARLTSIFLIWVAFESPAFAYLDGATGSIILQAMIGAVASWMVYYRMFKERAKALIGRVTGKAAKQTADE